MHGRALPDAGGGAGDEDDLVRQSGHVVNFRTFVVSVRENPTCQLVLTLQVLR